MAGGTRYKLKLVVAVARAAKSTLYPELFGGRTSLCRFSYAAPSTLGGKREEDEEGDILLQSIKENEEDAEYGGSLDEVCVCVCVGFVTSWCMGGGWVCACVIVCVLACVCDL